MTSDTSENLKEVDPEDLLESELSGEWRALYKEIRKIKPSEKHKKLEDCDGRKLSPEDICELEGKLLYSNLTMDRQLMCIFSKTLANLFLLIPGGHTR